MVRTLTRRRAKVSVSVDSRLLATVDRFVAVHAGTNRSGVFDDALWLWCAQVQDEAMAAQFSEPDEVDPGEWASWTAIRDSAAQRTLGRRTE